MSATTLTRAEKLARLKQLQQNQAELALFDLSNKQKRFWFAQQMDPKSGLNNIFRAFRFTSKPDVTLLQQAITAVMKQHPALTSKVVTVKDEPKQFSQALSALPFTTLTVEDRLQLQQRVEQEAQTPFALSQDYPCRFMLLNSETHPEEYIFTLCFHHIALDGLSVVMVEQAILRHYTSAHLEPVSATYTFENLLASQNIDHTAMEQYWLERLANTQHQLNLALNSHATTSDLQQGDYVNFHFDDDTSQQISEHCKRLGVTPSVFFLAAYQILLHKLSGQDNFIVGVPELGRNTQQQRTMVGNFANTLLLPAQIDTELTIAAFIAKLQQHFYQDLANNQVAVERLVELLGAERHGTENPLFQVMFSYNNLESSQTQPKQQSVWQRYQIQRHYSKLDVTLEIQQQGEQFSGYFEYRAALFPKQQVQQWRDQLATIITTMMAESEHALSDIASFTPLQQQSILRNEVSNTPAVCFNQRLRHLSQVQADELALTATDHQQNWSYKDLVTAVENLATTIGDTVDAGQTVAISCAKRHHCVIAILAAHMAHCPFVVLDQALPEQRREFILKDAHVAALLSEESNVLTCKRLSQTTYSDTQLGYLVYTSGSTGQPKGVKIPRQALHNHCVAVAQCYQLDSTTKALQFSVLSFDLALEELFPVLYHGGHVILRPGIETPSFQQLNALITAHQINHLSLPTGYLHSWLEHLRELDQAIPEVIKLVVTGTEQLQNRVVENWFALADSKQQRLINAYGPSEATISCTAHEINQLDITRSPIPIGSALPYSQTYLLDRNGQPVAPYVLAELYIAGDNLAQGYQNLSTLTNEKFSVNPQINQRLYATGDLAYYDEQGLIYFKGREDDQVKFRGYRIELGEIARRLNQITGVVASACLIQDSTPEALVAYVVSKAKLQQDKLNYLLSQSLPDYMLPDHIVQLDELPLTARGKINHKALPKVNVDATLKQRVAAKSQLEAMILAIWQEVLNKPQVCCQTSFFTQGGHSLTALKALSLLAKKTGKELTLKQFFSAPTIAQQAQLLTEQIVQQSMSDLVKVSREKHMPLTHGQQQMYILDAYAGSSSLYNMPLLLQFDGPLQVDVLQQALSQLCARHEAFRTVFIAQQGETQQLVIDHTELNLAHQTLNADEAKAHFQAQIQSQFDLAQPAYRWTLYRISDTQHWLGLVIHHILCDGASLNILTKELSRCYHQLLLQQPWQPSPMPIQVIDFAHWQHTEQGESYLQRSQDYWLEELQGMPHKLDLPLDKPRPATPSFSGNRVSLRLDNSVSEQLEATANTLGISMYSLTLTAFAIVLYEQSRQQDFAIGTPVSGRPSHDLENVVGLFVNSLPIRMTLSPQSTVTELLQQTQERILSGFEQQSLPLHSLVQLLEVERALNYNPLFQVFFNFMTNSGESSHPITDELTLSLPQTPNTTARFDLTLTMLASPSGLEGHLEFAEELFDASTIKLLRDRYIELLTFLAKSTHCTVSELEEAAADKQLQINMGAVKAISEQPDLLAQIAQHAHTTPDKTALTFANTHWSYNKLHRDIITRAAQLNHCGVKAGDLVAVSLPRDGQLVINLLAIMYCGAAYLPLDPHYPVERLSFIANDANAQFLLSDKEQIEFDLPKRCTLLNYRNFATQSGDSVSSTVNSQQQAYCIYTSGSTGQPKGVDISRTNLNNFLYSMAEKPGCHTTDTVLAVTPYSFDISILELFLPLYCGATLVLSDEQQSKDGTALGQLITQHNVTLMQGTPASWRLLYSAGWQGKADLTCLVGGEALPTALAAQLAHDHQALWNMYGPTETTVWSSIKAISSDSAVTIGTPIHNTQFLVLNEHNQLARFGAKGQLAIAGEGLALGYRDRADLNEAKFITLAVEGKTIRAYLTGDLVRQLSNGEYSYIQRLDDQVKLRGYRIELQEIEATLEREVGLTHAAAVINHSQTEPVLVAFYVNQDGSHSETELLQALANQLPSFMIPTRFIALDSLPLTPSGKVDKKALSQYQITQATTYEAPRNDTEIMLCELWQNILGHEQVGINDNFFKLGGNSILAMKLVSALNDAFGLGNLTIADVLAHQSISQLGEHIEQIQLSQVDDEELAQLLMALEQEQ
ncbi:amino acid adenylation domain-containing protein [Pseudoalteromonas 'SMAR']|uniref:amino acid adenylation domain-containing protein n=1 Tax=Pseudoalteromonas 'SMAR' TaxID=3416908 RepID=UPI003AF2FFE9